jgi:hypothetical protein
VLGYSLYGQVSTRFDVCAFVFPGPLLHRLLVRLTATLCLGVCTLQAQAADAPTARTRPSLSGHLNPVPDAHATRRLGSVLVDGILDENAWRSARPVTDFTQAEPDEGQPATERTEVRFLYDDEALYIGAQLYDSRGRAGVRASLFRRDQDFDSDYLEVVFDSFHDHLSQAYFVVGAAGAKGDALGSGTYCCDNGWDPIWNAATTVSEDGWAAEIRIPLSQLRFSGDSIQTWGLQLRRFIFRRNELSQWSFWRKNQAGGPSRFGHLTGLDVPPARSRVELLPYLSLGVQRLAAQRSDPFNYGTSSIVRGGLDAKYLLTSSLTLDATLNPDFGQVEVDPEVINLTAFETSFDEKRPFFIANSGVFSFGSIRCFFCTSTEPLNAFYSRRIGAAPNGAGLAISKGDFASIPEATTILGAAKVTGRTANGLTIGLLDVVTERERAEYVRADDTRSSQVVEPLTNYAVARVTKELNGGNLVVGGIFTTVARRTPGELAFLLPRHAEVMGGDFVQTWRNRAYSLRGSFAFSNLIGEPSAISQRQRSSARYFQRPDRLIGSDGLFTNALNPNATAMRGGAAYMRLAKDVGDWAWEGMLNLRTPGFEPNDLAFLTRADYVAWGGNVKRFWSVPTKWYRTATVIGGGQVERNFDGDATDREVHLFASGQTPHFWTWSAFHIWRPDVLDDRLLRGGPTVKRRAARYLQGSVSSDPRRTVSVNAVGSSSWTRTGGWATSLGVGTAYRPSSRVRLSTRPAWSASASPLQYLQSVPDAAATEFGGNRYILSTLRSNEASLETRGALTLTPNLTVELYAQPLIASGKFSAFKEFDIPRGARFSEYGVDRGTISRTQGAGGRTTAYRIDPDGFGPATDFSITNPDFTRRSLRGTFVFRWEYRPGSVVYAAWTHLQSDRLPLGDLELTRDARGLFSGKPANALLLKASLWIPLKT